MAREEKWRGNWRMEWVASTLTVPRNVVYPALLTLMRTPRLPAVDWADAPADLNGLVRCDRKTKSGFCACAIRFRKHSTYNSVFCLCLQASKRGGGGLFLYLKPFYNDTVSVLTTNLVRLLNTLSLCLSHTHTHIYTYIHRLIDWLIYVYKYTHIYINSS
jgi:hypothetical protein